MKEFLISKNDSGQRLDKFVSKAVKKLPQSMIYKYIRLKRIKVNGKRSSPEVILVENDRIEMYINDEFFADASDNTDSFTRLEAKLSVVYEDENVIIMDKPKGMLTHSDDKEDFNTLINHMKAYLYGKGEYKPEKENSFVPALCNRIDRNTQGLVIGAKNAEALRILNEKIKNHEVKKTYLSIVIGNFEKKSGQIKNYMTKVSDEKRSFISKKESADAKIAISNYKVIKEKPFLSLLKIEIETGRTHQIRAQFAAEGHPLLGDLKYGTAKDNEMFKSLYGYRENSQVLCAYELKFSFTSDAGMLNYLGGKIFNAKRPKIIVEF